MSDRNERQNVPLSILARNALEPTRCHSPHSVARAFSPRVSLLAHLRACFAVDASNQSMPLALGPAVTLECRIAIPDCHQMPHGDVKFLGESAVLLALSVAATLVFVGRTFFSSRCREELPTNQNFVGVF